MICADFENLLTEYAEGRLDRIVSAEMEQHRRKCAQCHLLFQEVSRLVDDLHHSLPEFEPPERLVRAILEKTSGVYKRPSFWQAIVVPTFRPFLTQRFAAATAIMFVSLSMAISLVGPGLAGVTAADFKPSAMYKHADNFTHGVYHRLQEFNQWTKEVRAELQLWRTDWAGRIDYQIITALFRNYEDTQDKQQMKKESTPSKTGEPQSQKQQKKEGKPDKKSLLPQRMLMDVAKPYSASFRIPCGLEGLPESEPRPSGSGPSDESPLAYARGSAQTGYVVAAVNPPGFPGALQTNPNENLRLPL